MAALQAVTVYILLRASEDNEEATNFDVPLIYTMFVRQNFTAYVMSCLDFFFFFLIEPLRETENCRPGKSSYKYTRNSLRRQRTGMEGLDHGRIFTPVR